jgi:hypothetical protein
MVNYDLPWNPNRIEQRFGRVHRIGQTEVCRLWNLVATNTREGEVFNRLLEKIEEQRKAYGGKVFDVLGAAFDETPLRDLLVEAIRYGDLPEVRAKMHQVIDESVAHGLKELLEERALAHDSMKEADLAQMQRLMEGARARRLQPHYIEWAFHHGFERLGGRLARREKGRYVERHRRASTIWVSNREPAEWLSMTTDALLAQSAVDRLTSGAHTLIIEGPSYRQRERVAVDPDREARDAH